MTKVRSHDGSQSELFRHKPSRIPKYGLVVCAALVFLLSACGSSQTEGSASTEDQAEVATTATSEEETVTTEAEDTTTTAETPTTEATPASTTPEPAAETSSGNTFPDVIGAQATQDADGTWTFSATLSSPYDTPERYADAWRVVGPDGEVYGVRELLHDHANEQPFTRSQSGIEIPAGVTEVTVDGRDQLNGWGGQSVTVEIE